MQLIEVSNLGWGGGGCSSSFPQLALKNGGRGFLKGDMDCSSHRLGNPSHWDVHTKGRGEVFFDRACSIKKHHSPPPQAHTAMLLPGEGWDGTPPPQMHVPGDPAGS